MNRSDLGLLNEYANLSNGQVYFPNQKESIYKSLIARTCKVIQKTREGDIETSGCFIKNFSLGQVQVLTSSQDNTVLRSIQVVYDSNIYPATIDSLDLSSYGLCVLNIAADIQEVFEISMGNSSPQWGREIYFAGAPLKRPFSIVHQGCISSIQTLSSGNHYFTIDGKMVQGFMGGPVIDSINSIVRPQLIGVMNSKAPDIGSTAMISTLPIDILRHFQAPLVSAEKLSLYQENTWEAYNYLMQQLCFKEENDQSEVAINYSGYLCVFPHGFMILFASTRGLSLFDHTHTTDASDAKRQIASYFRIKFSQEVHQKIMEFSQKVKIKGQDGNTREEKYQLEGVPSLICIEGAWNETYNSNGAEVNWDELILNEKLHQHPAFKLSISSPTWDYNEKTPNLKGISFKHSTKPFKIWMHEKNNNARGSEEKSISEEIKKLSRYIEFIKKFNIARGEFHFEYGSMLPLTEKNQVNFTLLEKWCELEDSDPFLKRDKKSSSLLLKDLLAEYKKKQDKNNQDRLRLRLEEFFNAPSWEMYYSIKPVIGYISFNQFEKALDEYKKFNGLVGSLTTIDEDKFNRWKDALISANTYFNSEGKNSDLTQLMEKTQEYQNINANYVLTEKEKNAALSMSRGDLKNACKSFMSIYNTRGSRYPKQAFIDHEEFVKSLKEIGDDADFQIEFVDIESLKSWTNMLKCVVYDFSLTLQDDLIQQLIKEGIEYVAVNEKMRKNRSKIPPYEQDEARKKELEDALKRKYALFFEQHQDLTKGNYSFVQYVEAEIENLEQKLKSQNIFYFLRQDISSPFIEHHLLDQSQGIDFKKLKACIKILEELENYWREKSEVISQLIKDSKFIQKINVSHAATVDLINKIEDLKNGYKNIFIDEWINLEQTKKEDILEKLFKQLKIPRSFSSSTAQIEYNPQVDASHARLLLRNCYDEQIKTLIEKIDLSRANPDIDVSEALYKEFGEFYKKLHDIIVKKAENFEIIIDGEWVYNGEALEQKLIKKKATSSDYPFKSCASKKISDIFRFIGDIRETLCKQHTRVLQGNQLAYIESPFIKEEIEILEEFYEIVDKFFNLLKPLLYWDEIKTFHKNLLNIKKIKEALTNKTQLYIYKRIKNDGNGGFDILTHSKEGSELSHQEEVHAAIRH